VNVSASGHLKEQRSSPALDEIERITEVSQFYVKKFLGSKQEWHEDMEKHWLKFVQKKTYGWTPRFIRHLKKNFKLHGLSPRANYTDRATAACRRSDCQLLQIEGATWSA
jgi:hypothetical protein